MSERNFTLSIPAQPLTRLSEFDPEDEYRPEPEPEALPPVWLDGSARIGIHTSIAGGHRNALETAREAGVQRAADIFGESAAVAGRVGADCGSGCAGVSGAESGVRGWGRWWFMQII